MLTLQQILKIHAPELKEAKIKLVRHKDSRSEYRELIKEREGLLEYQKEQAKKIFHDCDYIISFIGKERRRSILVGIFKVGGVTFSGGKYYYDLEEQHVFDDLIDRLVIDWGEATRNWHQWYHLQEKEVVELLPQGYLGTFPGLLDFVLEFDELKRLTSNPEANADWRHHLASVNGIYLILDARSGQQYVGAAYGEQGIWGRWNEYANNHTGGNVELMRLMDNDPNYYRHFRYSVLQSLPSNVTAKEVIKWEALYKEKLGSRVHGLNLN